MHVPRFVVPGFAFLLAFMLLGCDAGGSDGSAAESPACGSRTGNTMSASVDGTAICTDIGSAQRFTSAGDRLSLVGIFDTATPQSSISINVDNPAVGTFNLAQADAENDALYGTESAGFIANRDEGGGSVTITALSDTRVEGTFSFTGVGYDNNDRRVGQARITDGRFDFAIGSSFGF
jgi:hypothetical protein